MQAELLFLLAVFFVPIFIAPAQPDTCETPRIHFTGG